ncbi:MAG: cadherin-like beta sandwich domain-containing protein [Clostridiales bacterium]|nr:cadherin-like beta sandwich domain-containing protein [Clostridiales bacterium]
MKKLLSLLLATLLLLTLAPLALAQPMLPPERLASLVHNAPNTGKMLPEHFDPYQNTYLLTVASWVSRITFTPTTSASNAVVTVNGQVVASGQKSQIIQMTDDPQAVQITVSVYGEGSILTAQNTYTIYLQRRPSERRTRVSAGYIIDYTLSDGIATVSADLVSLKYQDKSNLSSYVNETVYLYKYKTAPNCLFYYGTKNNPVRARNAVEFFNNYISTSNTLYYFIYIEDQIVAIMPYVDAD